MGSESETTEAVTKEPVVLHGEVRNATLVVRSTIGQVNPKVTEKMLEITPFASAHATVSRSYELVIKDDAGYPKGKTSVFISLPCYVEELEEVLDWVNERALKALRESADAANESAKNTAPSKRPRGG